MTEVDVGFGVVSVAAVAAVAGLLTQAIKFLGNHFQWFPKLQGPQAAYVAYGIAILIMSLLAFLGYSPIEQNTLINQIYAVIMGLLAGSTAQFGYEVTAKASGAKPEAAVTKSESGAPKPTPSIIAAMAVAALSVLTLTTVSTDNPVSTAVLEEQTYKASALTAGQSDLFITVPRSNINAQTQEDAEAASPVSVVAAQAEGQSTPAAPILGWYNRSFDEGRTQHWCLQGDPQVNDVIREILIKLNQAFPDNFIWIEDCSNPSYYGGAGRAAIECGMQSAVACAVYVGDTAGRVSHNPAYTDARPNRLQILRVAYAHELQHLLDLDHTPCGVNLDPGSHQPVASVMTPVDLDRGSSCSDPPALGLEPSDWYWLYDKYDIAKPQATPPPTPQGTQIAVEAWIIGTVPCPVGTEQWDTYCVSRSSPVLVPEGLTAWVHKVRIRPDGVVEWIDDWQYIDPANNNQ